MGKKPDKVLFFTCIALLVIGIMAVISASMEFSAKNFGNIYTYAIKHLIYGVLTGLILGVFLYKFPYKKLEKLALPIFLISLLSLFLVFVPPLSIESRGAQRWIDLGFASFQPSEFLKLALVIYLATWLSTHANNIKKSKGLVPFATIVLLVGLPLMLQPDLSTMLIIAIIAIAMYFTAGVRYRDILVLGTSAIGAALLFVWLSPYRLARLTTFLDRILDRNSDPLGSGYQTNQLLIAVGSGKLWGTGPMQGIQKNFLPLPMNDSIFAVWAEEMGLIGAAILLLCFIILAWRGFRIASSSTNMFGQLLAVGVTVWIFSQAMVNMGATLGILPLTGMPLPLISYGGSALTASMGALGLLLQISKETS